MRERLLNALAQVLMNNQGNRITPELVTGIVIGVGHLVPAEPAVPPVVRDVVEPDPDPGLDDS